MVKATVNWDSVETWQRLVSSMIATGYKPDLKSTAKYFGTTYDTLENRFRKLKKDAETLKAEVDGEQRGEVTTPSRIKSAPSTPAKAKTPKKQPLNAVANGRVTKKTPVKKKTAIKEEALIDETMLNSEEVFGGQEDLAPDFTGHNSGFESDLGMGDYGFN